MTSGRRPKKNKNRNHLGVAAVGFVALLMAAVLGVQTWQLRQKDELYRERVDRLEEQLAAEEKRSEELLEQQVYVHTKQYVEQMARQKFGLIKPDEVLIKGVE